MISRKEKEENKQMCECGHRRGQHAYMNWTICLKDCDCKRFKLKEMIGEEKK